MERCLCDYVVHGNTGPRIFPHPPVSGCVGCGPSNRVLYFICGLVLITVKTP